MPNARKGTLLEPLEEPLKEPFKEPLKEPLKEPYLGTWTVKIEPRLHAVEYGR